MHALVDLDYPRRALDVQLVEHATDAALQVARDVLVVELQRLAADAKEESAPGVLVAAQLIEQVPDGVEGVDRALLARGALGRFAALVAPHPGLQRPPQRDRLAHL